MLFGVDALLLLLLLLDDLDTEEELFDDLLVYLLEEGFDVVVDVPFVTALFELVELWRE